MCCCRKRSIVYMKIGYIYLEAIYRSPKNWGFCTNIKIITVNGGSGAKHKQFIEKTLGTKNKKEVPYSVYACLHFTANLKQTYSTANSIELKL